VFPECLMDSAQQRRYAMLHMGYRGDMAVHYNWSSGFHWF